MSDSSSVVRCATIPTPLGPLLAAATAEALCLLEYEAEPRAKAQLRRVLLRLDRVAERGQANPIDRVESELSAYFAGEPMAFETSIELVGTSFQKRVWEQLLTIPIGQTRSYAQIARALGDPNATRAVGAANGANPLSILVPCHRVVRTGGALGGYGGGLDRKRWLLDHEAQMTGATLLTD